MTFLGSPTNLLSSHSHFNVHRPAWLFSCPSQDDAVWLLPSQFLLGLTYFEVPEHIHNFFSALRLILGCPRVSASCLSLFTCFLHLLISRAAFLSPPLPAPPNLDPTLSSHNTGRLTPPFFQYFQLLMTFLHHATLFSSPPAVCRVSVRLYHCIFLTISSFPPR